MLDTAFAHPFVFKRLIRKASIKHVRLDYRLPRQTDDEDIYNLATLEDRIIVTQDKRFDKQITIKGTGIIVIPSYLTNEEIDILLSDFISGKDPKDYKGKATKI